MKTNPANATRVFLGWAVLAILPLPAPLHGASPGFPFAEDFQFQSLQDGTDNQNAARWTNGGVTLGRAKNRHSVNLGSSPRNEKIGNSAATIGIKDIAAQDVDGDGNLDVLIANDNGIFAHFVDDTNELGSIRPIRITEVAVPVKAMAFGDFDRDGRLDIAAANDASAVDFYRNTGSRGAFDTQSQVSSLRTIALAAVDLDGDGDLDLVLLQKKGNTVEVHLNDGAGNFSLRENAVPTTSGQNKALGVGDFNEDGRMDIVLAKTGLNVVHLGNGNGGFRDGQLLSHPGNKKDYRDIAVGDVNNDGHLDILVGVHQAQNILYLGDGSGNFDTGGRINHSGAWTIGVELADLDSDGDLDIAEGAAKKGSRVYVNQGAGIFNSGSVISGKTNAVAVGDVDRDGHPGMIRGRTPKELRVAKLTERVSAEPSTTRFNIGHGRVVSGKVNGVEGVPHVVFLTATEVQQEHTDIEYYLSNDGGRRWLRAHPGRSVRFPPGDDVSSERHDLRWRAELKSRSPIQTPTLTRVSIESVLQVFIDDEVFSNGQTYTETTHTITVGFTPTTATIRLMNRGEQALTVTGVGTVGEVFGLEDGQGQPLPHPLAEDMEIEEGGNGEDIRLVFNPMERGTYASMLTISGSEGGRVLPDIKVALRGKGIGAEIGAPKSVRRIEIPVGTSDRRTVEITNKGETPLTITSATVPDSVFSLIEPALPTTLTVSDPARNFRFRFKPEAPGTIATTITFISNAFNGTQTRTITGQGLAPIIEIPPPALISVRAGRRTTGEMVIRNTGDWAMDITAVTGTDEFFDFVSPTMASINGFGLTVPEGTTEKVVFSFTPARNMRSSPTANITFTSNAFNDTQTEVMLRGIGTAPEIDFEPSQADVNFGNVRVGESGTRTVVIENIGDEPLIVSGVRSKTTAADVRGLFSWVPPFPGAASQTVAAEATATLTLRFTPRIRRDAAFTDTLMIDSDAVNMTDKFLTVTGEGIAPVMAIAITGTGARKPRGSTAAVSLHDFGDVPINASTSREVYISNDGTAPLEVALSLVGGRGFRWESTPDGVITVEGGFSAADLEPAPDLVVHFRPKDREPDTARLIFRDTRNNLHTTYTLTGQGLEAEMELRMGDDILDENTTHTISAIRAKTTTTVHVEVHNLGNVSMTVSSLVQPDRGDIEGFTPTEADDVSKVVTGGQSVTFGFQFNPRKRGTAINSVTFNSDAVSGGKQTIILQGRAVGPVISTVPDERTGVRFGGVRVGNSTDREVVITNTGDAPLMVTSVEVINTGAASVSESVLTVVNHPEFPKEVPVSGTLSLTLRFTPENRNGIGGFLLIGSDAFSSDGPMPVFGQGLAGEISIVVTATDVIVTPTGDNRFMLETVLYNFGSVPVGTSASAKVFIANEHGNAPLRVEIEEIDNPHFRWENRPERGVIDLDERTSSSLILTFEPESLGVKTTGFAVESDAYNATRTNVMLAGRGVKPMMVVEVGGKRRVSGTDFNLRAPPNVGVTTDIVVWNRGSGDLIVHSIGLLRGDDFTDEIGHYRLPGGAMTIPENSFHAWPLHFTPPDIAAIYTRSIRIVSNDDEASPFTLGVWGFGVGPDMHVHIGSPVSIDTESTETRKRNHDFGAVMVGTSETVPLTIRNVGNRPLSATILVSGSAYRLLKKDGSSAENRLITIDVGLDEPLALRFMPPTSPAPYGETLTITSNDHDEGIYKVTLTGRGVSAQSWADGAQRPAIPTFTALEPADAGAPRFVGLGYADKQSRLWLAFDEPAQILSGTGALALADGAALSGFEVLPNYTGGDGVEDIGVLRARYRSGGVVMDLARGIVSADALIWARYTPPSDGVSGIYDMANPPNRIASVRLFMLPRSAVLDYDGDGFPDALEARLGGNPLVPDDVVGLPEVALLRAGVVGSPAAVAYSGIRADGVAAHLGVVTTGASSLAAYYLSDTFGYSGGYALGVDGYGCTGRFPADYALPLRGGGCAVVDFNSIRAGVEHRIGWLATNAAGYWAVAEDTASRLPEMVILRVPEFNMKRRNVFVGNSAAADATVVVGAFHDGPASSQSLTVSLSNVAAADSLSSSQPDGFSVSVAGGAPNTTPDTTPGSAADAMTSATPDITSYAITGVHSGEASRLWLAGDPLSSLTPDKYSLGKVTQTDVIRLADDNLPPLFGRASLYVGTTAGVNERHAVVVRGTENYIALLPVVHGSAQTASAFEVSPWDGAGGGPVAADDRILAVNRTSPAADGAVVRIAFTASNPPATVRNTVSLEVAASSAGASTATTVLTWPVIDSADVLASIAGDSDNDGIPDVRDSYRLLNRLPIAVAGGVSNSPDRSSAGADGWHHIRPLLPLHSQHIGSYATRAGLSFHTGFNGDARILAHIPVATSGQAIVTSGGETIAAPEGQSVLAATYQPSIPIQMNYADFAASLSRDEFSAMAQQSRRDIAVVYNFRLHGVEPSGAQDATLAGGRAGVVIPLPESLRETTNILLLHYTNGAWSGFSTEPDKPATAGFAPLQAGVCPDDSGIAGSPYRTESGALNTRKRTGDACLVLYLTDGAAADRDGNINGVVDALIGLAATTPLH